jgi:thiamine kinase-like enzyme
MIELLEDYIRNNWQSLHMPFVAPKRLSYFLLKGFRKTIFFIFKDNDLQPFVVLKATNDPIAFERLEREYETLSYLSTQESIKSHVPIPLAFFEMMKHTCLLESALDGAPLVYSIKGIRSKKALKKMKNFFTLVVDFLVSLSHKQERVENDHSVRSVVEHGDFNPPNMFVSKHGIKIFDWEYSNMSGIPLHDLLDFSLKYVLFARYLDHEVTREKPVLNDFEEAFLSRKPHNNIIWEHISIYKEKMNISNPSMLDIFSNFSKKYLSESDARDFCKDLDNVIYSL